MPSNKFRQYHLRILVYSQKFIPNIHTTRSKISYSLIEPQPLPCTPACGHEFHALAFQSHPTFTAPLVRSAFRIQPEVCGGAILRKQATCLSCSLFFQRCSDVDVWQLCLRKFPPLRLYKEISNSSYLLILLIHTIHKYNKI